MNTEVEDIKARLSVREVIGGYVQLTKAGVSWKGLCPFHHEKSPSFIVNEERASWHCFGCGKGGDIFSFVMEIDGLSFPEALALLAERAGIVLERRSRRGTGAMYGGTLSNEGGDVESVSDAGISKERLFAILDLSSKFFEKQLWDGEGKKKALPYLRDRGLSDESIRTFRLGYALPGWRTLSDFLAGKEFSPSEIEAAGMAVSRQSAISSQQSGGNNQQSTVSSQQGTRNKEQKTNNKQSKAESRQLIAGTYDRFRDRVTFPVFDVVGRVIGFSARVLPGADETTAKYINTPETFVYHKSRALYGFFQAKRAIRERQQALFVEGNMDVIAMYQAGFPETVAVSGTALTEEQLRIVKRYTDRLLLFFDMDSAGQKASRKSAETALLLGFSVSVVSIGGGKDAAELARENVESLRDALTGALPAPEYFLRRACAERDCRTAEGKQRIAEDILSLVSCVAKKIEQAHWVHILSNRIGVAEHDLFALLKSTALPVVKDSERALESEVAERVPKKQVFQLSSERIGRDVAAILLACPALLPLPLENVPERVFSFVSRNPLLSFLSGETPETFSFSAIPEEMKLEASEGAFSGEKLLGSSGDSDGIDVEHARMVFDQIWARLSDELRREEMRDIERAMRLAHDRGDREEEQRLNTRLFDVGRE